jgi:hypothetical protein
MMRQPEPNVTNQYCSEEISEFARRLVAERSATQASSVEASNVGNEILEQLQDIKRWQENLERAFKQLRFDQTINRSLFGNDGTLRPDVNDHYEVFWPISRLSTTLIDGLLNSLQFQAITAREERIAEAHVRTFEWIFESSRSSARPWSSFGDWLQTGSGLYWITGKAGSGKSTLMKYVVHHEKTMAILRAWAHRAIPIVASFYFWHAGNRMQTSQEGLLQTLLHQAISQCRARSSDTFERRWESFALSKDFSESWTWPELEKAFKFLLEEQDPSLKFCFFIDGLDEFQGNLDALIALTKRISLYRNTKICVSSRPWIIFEDAFRTKPQLMLQDLTRGDIGTYVEDKLTDNPGFMELRCMDEEYARTLIGNVAEKSDGVFLWVVLAVGSLLEGLRDGDRLADLQKRLDDLPEELNDLFRRILHNFDTRYFRDASVLFQLFKVWNGSVKLLPLALAEQADDGLVVRAEIHPMGTVEKFYKSLNMRRRLDSRCKGLLEVEPIRRQISDNEVQIIRDVSQLNCDDGELLAESRVEFLHRTVSEFLDKDDIWAQFIEATGDDFNPYAAVARSCLLQLKWTCSDPSILRASPLWNPIFGTLEYAEKSWKQKEVSQNRVLDELDRSATFLLCERQGPGGLSILERSGRDQPFNWPTPSKSLRFLGFLDLVMKFDLPKYVDDKLTERPQPKSRLWSLLLNIGKSKFEYVIDGEHRERCVTPSAEMVSVLTGHLKLTDQERTDLLQKARKITEERTHPADSFLVGRTRDVFIQRVREICDKRRAEQQSEQSQRRTRSGTQSSIVGSACTESADASENFSVSTYTSPAMQGPQLHLRFPLRGLIRWKKK